MKDLKLQKVLLIEDYPAMSTAIKTMLFSLHITDIIEVSTGLAAVQMLKKHPFDIILCDYNLGKGKNGLQVLEEARERKLMAPNAAFIIVTAEKMQSMVLGVMENNPDDYLSKPFTAELLLARIKRVLERKEYFLKIDAAVFNDNYPLAIEHCSALLKSNPGKMHLPLLRKRAELALYMQDYKSAEEIYRLILKERDLDWALLGSAKTYQYQNKHIEAIKLFTECIKKFPMCMGAYDALAKSYEVVNEPEKAQATLNNAIKLSPNILTRQRKLATIAKKTGDLYTAEVAGKSVLTLGEHSIYKAPTDFSELAQTLGAANKTAEALEILETLSQEFPSNTSVKLLASIAKTEILHDAGEIKQSEDAFSNVISLKQHEKSLEKQSKLSMAKVCHINHEEELAGQILDELINNNIDDDAFINDINTMHTSIGREHQSEKSIDLAKKELVKINNKAITLFKQGNIDAAIEVFFGAFKKMPENKTIVLNIIKILIHQAKSQGITPASLKKIKFYINTAKKIGVEQEKLDGIQVQYARLMHKLKKQ